MLRRFDEVMAIMLPSLRAERAQTYSPFLPICPRTGIVLQVPILARDVEAGTISYDDPETGERMITPVTGGRCKLQWKPDWAMRWIGARRRLRDGRQGFDRLGETVWRNLPRARRHAAGGL